MPVLGIFSAVLESLVVFAAPIDPEVIRQIPCAGFIAAEDMRDNFAVVTRVSNASRDSHTLCVDMLRCVIFSVCDVYSGNLRTISTSTDGN